ncbi:MAG: hypothetical protein ACK5L5_04115 [Bacteroidales bacterium]
MAVYREIWTKEVIKGLGLKLKDTFLDGVPDKSQYVTGDDEAQVIHSTFFGVQPEVLINNNTYPLGIQELHGQDVPIILDKYQTKATPITDDELHALAYDKIATVKESHVDAIAANRLKKAIHAFAPATNTTKTPILTTSGDADATGLRKRLVWEDIIALRQAYADADIPIENLRLVLCSDHVNDLLLQDTTFKRSYADFKGGVITNQLGFEIREFSHNPYFDAISKTKLAFGALPTASARQASVCFNVKLARKATGKTTMYYSDAKTDPLNQRNLVNFRNYFIALPSINEAIGAIVSDSQ